MNFKKIQNAKGFTLIEALVMLFIFSVIALTFYRTYSVGLKYVIDAKNRLGAVAAANEKMEIIRNLNYNDIGTTTGEISGNIPSEEDVAENASQYQIATNVEYVDDPFDGLYSAGTDPIPEDYKKVTVTVYWNNKQENVQAQSIFAPPGLEVANPSDGILMINVFSDQPGGTGIPDSTVRVTNSDIGLDTTVQTDNTGHAILMGNNVKNSIQKYHITLAKSGYENVSTMPPYPATSYNPVDVDGSVIVGSTNVVNIVQDQLANLAVDTTDYLGTASIPNISFHITGGRILGNTIGDPSTGILPQPVYNLDTDAQTDSNGEKNFGSVSPGQYTVALSPSVTGYVLIDTDPVSPFSLFSNQNMAVKAKLADVNQTSLLVKVTKNDTGNPPLAGAGVELSNGSGYDQTVTASGTGTAYFPTDANALPAGTYTLKVTAGGYTENDSQVTINSNQLKQMSVSLTAS